MKGDTGERKAIMGKFLHKAFDARQTGDYEEEVEITKAQATEVLGFAVQFVKSIEEQLAKST